ncbi:hypothetical protein ATANTOWER_027992 [Ataeniobius toweri]|uniref:Secreted protein n=1 Tax=Ataeniobius toweri TaxID=208326 RepID=A0ABU7BJX3_9TELE|nr:hypothetical protein [Ataeniobius toweri]
MVHSNNHSLAVHWSLIQVTSCALVSVGLLSSTTKGSPWFRCLGALAPMKPRVSFALQPHCVGCPLGHLVWSCEPWLHPLPLDDPHPHPLNLGVVGSPVDLSDPRTLL